MHCCGLIVVDWYAVPIIKFKKKMVSFLARSCLSVGVLISSVCVSVYYVCVCVLVCVSALGFYLCVYMYLSKYIWVSVFFPSLNVL